MTVPAWRSMLLALLFCWLSTALNYNETFETLLPRENVAPGIPLRILPLGDSITAGEKSSDGNGYRLRLQQNLGGSQLTLVGAHTNGNMNDAWNGGYGGRTISQIRAYAPRNLDYHPNVILIHGGTNDLITNPLNEPTDQAITRLGYLIDQCLLAEPDAVVLVAQIIGTTRSDRGDSQGRIDSYNNQIPGLVQARVDAGYQVLTVDMRRITGRLLIDGVHPTDEGYRIMGDNWYQAIKRAVSLGWVKSPKGTGDPKFSAKTPVKGGQVCKTGPDWTSDPYSAKQNTPGISGHDGPWGFTSSFKSFPGVAPGLNRDIGGVRFADINGDGKDDYLWLSPTGAMTAYVNQINVQNQQWSWKPANGDDGLIAPGAGAKRENVFINDMNGDGLADYVVLTSKGIDIYFNNGYDASHTPYKWSYHAAISYTVSGLGTDAGKISIADINGDDRDDIMQLGPNGQMQMWMNVNGGNVGEHAIDFIDQGQIAPGTGSAIVSQADINGDGRADYLAWQPDGGWKAWISLRTARDGQPRYEPVGDFFPANTTISPFAVRLADLDGDGKVDILRVYENTGKVDLYQNTGAGSAARMGDGLHFADLDGDGDDEYIYVGLDGAVGVYLNRGPNSDHATGWYYERQQNPVFQPPPGTKQHQVRFADLDNDGKADYCIVGDNDGSLTCWLNRYSSGRWQWDFAGQIVPGLGGPGVNVRLADIDGDGLADYVKVYSVNDAKNDPQAGVLAGAIKVYKNLGQLGKPHSWVPMDIGYDSGSRNRQPVALGIGVQPDQIFMHDLNGDGKADYIWIDQPTGAVRAWINRIDPSSADTNHIAWERLPGLTADGVIPSDPTFESHGFHYAGQSIKFGKLTRSGRSDYFAVRPADAALWVWVNSCPELGPNDGTGGAAEGPQPPIPGPPSALPRRTPSKTTTTNSPAGQPTSTFSPIRHAPSGCPDENTYPTADQCANKALYNPGVPIKKDRIPCSNTGTWKQKNCNNDALTNRFSGGKRWGAADASAAWTDATNFWFNLLNWNADPRCGQDPISASFPLAISNYFNYRDNYECQFELGSDCTISPLCDETNYPAGWLILESFSQIHNMWSILDTTINNTQQTLNSRMQDFATKFARQPTTKVAPSAILGDILGVVGGLFTAGLWSNVVKDALALTGKLGAKVGTNTGHVADFAVIAGVSAFRDTQTQPQSSPEVAGRLVGILNDVFNAFVKANNNLFQKMFSPQVPSDLTPLTQLLEATWLLEPNVFVSNDSMLRNVMTTGYGVLFTQVWSFSLPQAESTTPFIFRVPKENYNCKTQTDFQQMTRIAGEQPIARSGASRLVDWVSEDTLRKTIYCDDDGNSFFLLGHINKGHDSVSTIVENTRAKFPTRCNRDDCLLTSNNGGTTDVLTGGDAYGGITIERMVKSSWQGYVNNGYSNGATPRPDTDLGPDSDPLVLPYLLGVDTPGFFTFSICHTMTQYFNCVFYEHCDTAFWPCGVDGGAAQVGIKRWT